MTLVGVLLGSSPSLYSCNRIRLLIVCDVSKSKPISKVIVGEEGSYPLLSVWVFFHPLLVFSIKFKLIVFLCGGEGGNV